MRVDNTATRRIDHRTSMRRTSSRERFTVTSRTQPTPARGRQRFQRSPAGTNWTTQRRQTADTTSPYSASWVTTGVIDGLYDLQVITTDKSGNTFTSALITNVRVDNTAPTGAVTAPAAAANVRGSVAVTSNSADAGSGVASAQFQSSPHSAATWTNVGAADTTSPYSVSWDTTTYTDGLYDLRVITTDNVGNTFTSATIASVRVDNTAPTGSITAPAAAANIKGTFTVTSNSADAGSGVANALFQRSPAGTNTWTNVAAADTTSPYTASWVTTGVSDGLYDLQVITTDKSGNTFTSALVTNVRVDNTAPTVSVVVASGATGAFQSGTKIYFKSNAAGSFGLVATVTDGGSGAASATFPVLATTGWTHAAETVTTPAGGPYASSSFAWTSGASTPGTYTVTVADAAGNTATSAFTFTADPTAPTGSVTAPAAAANVRGSVAVTSNSADAGAGVNSAQFQTSPAGAGTWSNLGAADTVTPYSTTWDTTTYTDGLYDLRVVTTDNVGNTFTSATIANVRVDNTAPTGSITAPAANAFVDGASVAVSASSADAGSGVSSAQFQTSPHGASTWTNLGAADATSPYGVTWNTTTYTDGQYDLQVVTTDKSGNTFTSAAVMVEVQNAAPTATAVQLLDNGGTAGKTEQGDRIIVTFSQTLRVSTMCSTWSGDFTDQSLAALGDVTVTLTDGGVANDTLTVTSASCTYHFGTINLGSTGYATGGNVTFSGSTTADKSTIAWNATTHTLTITLGHSAGTGTVGTVASSGDVHARRRDQERLRDRHHRHVQHRNAHPVLTLLRCRGVGDAFECVGEELPSRGVGVGPAEHAEPVADREHKGCKFHRGKRRRGAFLREEVGEHGGKAFASPAQLCRLLGGKLGMACDVEPELQGEEVPVVGVVALAVEPRREAVDDAPAIHGERPCDGSAAGLAFVEQREEQLLFGGEVGVDRAGRAPGHVCDLLHAGSAVATTGKHDRRCLEELRAGALLRFRPGQTLT